MTPKADCPLPMLTVAGDGTVAGANAAAGRALGLAAGALVGRPVTGLAVTPEAISRLWRGDGAAIEVEWRLADGGALPTLAAAAPGDAGSVVIAFADARAPAERERALRLVMEQAERSMRGKMRFFAAASHDLRQPLQALALFVSALDSHLGEGQPRLILQSIKVSLKAMEEMFESLLDMSRLDAGVLRPNLRAFMVGDILELLDAEFTPQARAAGSALTVLPSSAAVFSDGHLLTRIVRNFLSNAVRYAPASRILVGCRRRGPALRIEVWDTGPGIPASQRAKIFEEFYQAGEAAPSRSSGLGLGLSIVQRLARLLGLRLDLRSEPGRGSMFSVEVPLATSQHLGGQHPDGEDAAAAGPDDRREPDLAGAVILLVDDERDIRDAIRLLLEQWGCRPIVAATTDEALSRLNADGVKPDVVLADWGLGGDDGAATIAAVRRQVGRAVPAFVFTGSTETADSGGHPVLHKPIDPPRLRAVLAEALGRV